MGQLLPQDIAYLRSQGYSEDDIAKASIDDSNQQSANSSDSKTSTVGKQLEAKYGGLVGGGAGSLLGGKVSSVLYNALKAGGKGLLTGEVAGGGPEDPLADIAGAGLGIGGIVSSLIGATAGGATGGYAGQKLQQEVTPTDVYNTQQQDAEQSSQTNPKTALATDIISSALASGGKPSTDAIKGIRGLIGKLAGQGISDADKSSLIGTAINAGINPAINAGISAATGQDISGGDLAAQALGGAVFGKQANWASRITGGSHNELQQQDEPKPEVKNSESESGLGQQTTTTPTQTTPFTEVDNNGDYKINSREIKKLYINQNTKSIPDDADDITKAQLNTQNDNLKKVPISDMRDSLHQNALQKAVLPDTQDDPDNTSTTATPEQVQLPETTNSSQAGEVKQPDVSVPEDAKPVEQPGNQPNIDSLPKVPESTGTVPQQTKATYNGLSGGKPSKGIPPLHMWDLTSDIKDANGNMLHPKGSTVGENTLNKYNVPYDKPVETPAKPSVEPTTPSKEQSKTPVQQGVPPTRYMSRDVYNTFPVIDKIRKLGTPEAKLIADHMQMAVDKEAELKGQWKNRTAQVGETLSDSDKSRLMDVLNHELETKTLVPQMLGNQAQRNAYAKIKQLLDVSGKHRQAIGEPITQVSIKNGRNVYTKRNLIQDPTYFPGMANQKVTQVYRDNTNPKAIAALDKEFHEYNINKLGLTPAESTERIADYKKALQGSLHTSNNSHQDQFNANRKMQGIPLPRSFRESDPIKNLERYFDRSAIDSSHYEFMEKPHDVLAALGETKDAWDNNVTPNPNGSLANNQDVKNGLAHWKGEHVSPAEGNEHSLSSLVTSAFISGPALEAHKLISNVVSSAALSTNPLQVGRALVYGLSHMISGYDHAVENGVVHLTAKSVLGMFSSNNTSAEKMQALARGIRKISSIGDITTKVGAGLVQAMNESIIPSKVLRANRGDVTSQLFLRRLDPTYTPGKQYSPDEMNKLASRSASYIHGTGDIRSLPAWMLNDSEFSGFFSLAHWSIAQTDNFMKNIYEPATRGDFKPLLMGVFGAAVGGYLIKELRQDIQGKKSPIPSLSDIAASDKGLEGNKNLLAYNLIAAMQYSGFGGLLSQVVKYPFDFAYKNTPQGATFPLDEVATDTAETLHYVTEAITNDPNVNWVDLAKAVTMHMLSTNFQLGRIAINQGINNGLITGLPAEKKDLADKLGQLRRFDMVEGLPYNDVDNGSNPYMNLEQKKYHSEQGLGKAVQELPTLVQNIVSTYGDKPDVMMSKLKALKENQYSTFPSLQDTPISFYKYIGYLSREEGPEKAQEELQDYLKHKVTNEVKASVVP